MIGADGILATITNPQADRSLLDIAAAEARRAEAEVDSATRLIADLESQREHVVANYSRYREIYTRDLPLDHDGTVERLERIDAELALLRGTADRAKRLSNRGFVAQSDRDEASLRVASSESLRADQAARLERILLRREAAKDRVYPMDDGSEPIWAGGDREAVERALSHARVKLAAAEAHLESAWSDSHAVDSIYRQVRQSNALVPPGSMVRSVLVGEGAALEIGDPIADWIDCGELLVDVPMTDAELALLQPGLTADVVMEGESELRAGTVVPTRGSAAVLDRTDLAAVSKARGDDGQVILKIEPDPDDQASCPVGHAAFVDFHDVGLVDVILARLRLR